MKLASWNVNSIRSREERLVAWLGKHAPDVLCVQELKTEEKTFPHDAITRTGYHCAAAFQKTYNGVAILSKKPISDVRTGFQDGEDDTQARFVSGVVDGIRVLCAYCPNGQSVGSEKWDYKLHWMKRLRKYLDTHHSPDEKLALCGDFNVAPEPRDVHDPAIWEKEVLFHPDGRRALDHIMAFGLKDSLRLHTDAAGIYTWWDYRMLGFPKNFGLRIDLILLTASLAKHCTAASVDRDERKGKQPSDHAPILVEIRGS